MRKVVCLFAAFVICSLPASTAAQVGIGVAGHVGTMGLGVDVAIQAAPNVGVRVGGNVIPVDLDGTFSDVDFTMELQSPQYTAMLDLYPIGCFRLSGGLRYSNSNIILSGDVSESVDIGGTSYSLDSLIGTIVTPDLSPYVGIGLGNPAASRFGFFLDLGVAYQGEPELDLDAFGNATTIPGFDEDLEDERLDIEDALGTYFKFYPVISLGISIGL